MLQLVFRNRLIKIIAIAAFIAGTTLLGFASYTHQKIEEFAGPRIFINPSQLPTSKTAYVPHAFTKKLEVSHERQASLVSRLKELYASGLINEVVCEGPTYNQLVMAGIRVTRNTYPKSSIYQEMASIANTSHTQTLIIVADRIHLAQCLYSLRTLGIDATGWDFEHKNNPPFQLSNYLAQVQLYFDCTLSKPDPLIANPRYTLDIQH